MKYPPTNCLAVDVDGTLHTNGVPNKAVIAWVEQRRAQGMYCILWSARGVDHAKAMAAQFGCEHLFDVIIPKPGHILDDKGWGWIKFTNVVRNLRRPLKASAEQADTRNQEEGELLEGR
jgi:hypothetical protein